MKELKKAFKCTLLFQLLCWGVFILCDENKLVSMHIAEQIAMIVGLIILIGLLIFYFVFKNKFIKKNELNSMRFNIFLFILWIIFTILIYLSLEYLLIGKYLHVCDDSPSPFSCFLNGIEYLFFALFVFILPIITLIINLIIKLCKYIKRKIIN